MEQSEEEVFYETRYHASRACSSNYPPRPQQVNEASNWSFLSLLSRSGVGQLKEKWSGYRSKRNPRKWISLFVSPRGERVAVAMGSQITILNKNDDYHEPHGTFTSCNSNSFTCGTWSESHDVLGVLDDLGVLFFIKANGEEITRITRALLKPSLPIIGVIMLDGADMEKSCLCSFNVLTSDGSLHEVEISQELHSSISSASSKRGFPDNVICVNYHTDLSLLAVIGDGVGGPMNSATGTCSLSLWRRIRNLDLEPLFSMQIEGWYSKPKGYVGKISCPKVLISPQGKFVASLDIKGCLVIFKLDDGRLSPLSHHGGEKFGSFVPGDSLDKEVQSLTEILDFAWWSDYVLVLARRSGSITMISTCSGKKVLYNDPVFSMPILERVQQVPGHVFLLEMIPSQEKSDLSSVVVENTVQDIDLVTEDQNNPHNIDKLHWNLVSFSKRSVSEMFDVLISTQKFQAALDFANCHGLEKDKVLKSQWLQSVQGLNEINTFLARIKDQAFVLSECLDRIGPTEDAMRALLTLGIKLTNQHAVSDSDINENSQIWEFCLARLKFLQFRDKLETFLGINMGRFSMQEYSRFRVVPIREAAVTLSENGKIGALNLLFKRHPYSLMPSMLEILASIPETVPVRSYQQLLPGNSPPPSISLREKDWVECQEVARYINQLPENHESKTLLRTEPIVKHFLGFSWPSTDDLSSWYKSRARDMDSLSGQLDNCLCLVDIACSKGIPQLKHFYEDISYLHQLIYSDANNDDTSYTMSLVAWEQLSDYEKFKMILKGTNEENVIERLREKAVPFMVSRSHTRLSVSEEAVSGEHANAVVQTDTFLVAWMKETAFENRLDLCLKVIEEGSIEFQGNIFFRDMNEAVDCALHCIYLCTAADKWTTMSLILSKVPEMRDSDTCTQRLKKRVKQVEGHIESGRLLSFYQVPKPVGYFLEEHSDGKGVKQILRLILSKFIRRQPGRSDSDWANMWRDLLVLQEKAFPFLDQEYMLMEFCRGLLKAGKFSLARNYLRGTASVPLGTEKAENIVIQAAREYFFSASSLSCTEIWKAKECLSLLPSSRNVRAEADIIDALTVKLPNLGVNILPMQFRQVKDPMEIIKLAITSQVGAYLNVDELIEIAKLLGLSSQDDISVVQETIAREAAVAGDLQLAFDLCIILAKKNHGPIWDLCAAMARGPNLENMDVTSRKQLLGFALSHCDEESIGELLNAWKDLDLQGQIQILNKLNQQDPPRYASSFPSHSPLDHQLTHREYLELANKMNCSEQESSITNIEKVVASVAKDFSFDRRQDWETLLSENASLFSFASVQLQWLLELCAQAEQSGKVLTYSEPGRFGISVKVQALVAILSWLAKHSLTPKDDLIASLAKSFLDPPATEEEDIIGCSFLLNLLDAFRGVEIIEQQMRTREAYDQICSIMGVGMIYGVLHNAAVRCQGPMQRRELLLKKFQDAHQPVSSGELEKIGGFQSSFWRDWKQKLEEQKRIADHSRVLEQLIPDVDASRFLAGDTNYIETVVCALIDSVKSEKKVTSKDLQKLAHTYDLNLNKVLLQYTSSILVSDVWTIDDVTTEISEFKSKILEYSAETINTISLQVYPAIDGHDKQRLAYIYGLLSDCCSQLDDNTVLLPILHPDYSSMNFGLANFYRILEQECIRVSSIKNLNFKNIAALSGLNMKSFSTEVFAHIDEHSVEALAIMVRNLVSIYGDPIKEGLISWQSVYRQYILHVITTLELRAKSEIQFETPEKLYGFIDELEQVYENCRKYVEDMGYSGTFDMIMRFFTVVAADSDSEGYITNDPIWKDCLISLVMFWLRVIENAKDSTSFNTPEENDGVECLMSSLQVFVRLVAEGRVSPVQGWGTIFRFVSHGSLTGDFTNSILAIFCRGVIFSSCSFGVVEEIYFEAVSQLNNTNTTLAELYSDILESLLLDLSAGCDVQDNLHSLLSSLSRMEGNLENLKSVRRSIWNKMAKFSDNLELPSNSRVCALELMQYITKASEPLQSNVVNPWEGWVDLKILTTQDSTNSQEGLTNTLVALKSSQLLKALSPNVEISAEDLSSVDSAVSCFLKLCGEVTSESHVDTLLAILAEWEGNYSPAKEDVGLPTEASDSSWDDGWESFPEEPSSSKESTHKEFLLHPLHLCWLEILKILVKQSRFKDIITVIDQSILKPDGILLNQDGADSLSKIALEVNCFAALKISLLFPYETISLQCLEAVEDKLKHDGIQETISKDHEFLVLSLSSGVISTIISNPKYGSVFSYICYMVGYFSRQCQQARLKGEVDEIQNIEKDILPIFRLIIFPCFVSELVKAEQKVLAGVLVTKIMHANTSLSLINIAEASLKTFLLKQVKMSHSGGNLPANSSRALCNSLIKLRDKLGSLVASALSSV